MTATLIGYARCSTDEQDLTAQRGILAGLGVAEDRVYLCPASSRWQVLGFGKVGDGGLHDAVEASGDGSLEAATDIAVSLALGGPLEPNYVRVVLNCSVRRGQSTEICVRVERGVPEPLRCTPSGGAPSVGGGGHPCPSCAVLLAGRIAEVVNDRIRRGWSEHIEAGAVRVDC